MSVWLVACSASFSATGSGLISCQSCLRLCVWGWGKGPKVTFNSKGKTLVISLTCFGADSQDTAGTHQTHLRCPLPHDQQMSNFSFNTKSSATISIQHHNCCHLETTCSFTSQDLKWRTILFINVLQTPSFFHIPGLKMENNLVYQCPPNAFNWVCSIPSGGNDYINFSFSASMLESW